VLRIPTHQDLKMPETVATITDYSKVMVLITLDASTPPHFEQTVKVSTLIGQLRDLRQSVKIRDLCLLMQASMANQCRSWAV
jgi:hypothetical protein